MVAGEATSHHEETFEGAGGLKLFTQAWRPASPRGALVVMHGLKDHGARYEELARALNARSVAVHAADLRGHGRSAGARVYVDSFEEYVEDLDRQVARVKALEGDVPVFVLGHSMGGQIVTRWALDRRPAIRGVVLSAPALTIAKDESRALLAIAKVLAVVAPRAGVHELDLDGFSRDPAVVAAIRKDPLVVEGKGPARTAVELVRSIERVETGFEAFSLPLLVLHGTKDRVTVPGGSSELHRRAASADKTLKLYDGLFHDLTHEPERQQVIDDVVAWIDARL